LRIRPKDLEEKLVANALKISKGHVRAGKKKGRADIGGKKVKGPKTKARLPQ